MAFNIFTSRSWLVSSDENWLDDSIRPEARYWDVVISTDEISSEQQMFEELTRTLVSKRPIRSWPGFGELTLAQCDIPSDAIVIIQLRGAIGASHLSPRTRTMLITSLCNFAYREQVMGRLVKLFMVDL